MIRMDAGEPGPRVFDACTDDLGELVEEMSERGWELVAADELRVVAKSLFDAVVIKDSKSDGRLSYPASTDESGCGEVLCETNDLLDHLVVSKDGPRRRRGLFRHARCKD